jgi:hypothetical protein
MNLLEQMSRQLTWQLVHAIDWAIRNWAVTMAILVALIYWAGRQRKLDRNRL